MEFPDVLMFRFGGVLCWYWFVIAWCQIWLVENSVWSVAIFVSLIILKQPYIIFTLKVVSQNNPVNTLRSVQYSVPKYCLTFYSVVSLLAQKQSLTSLSRVLGASLSVNAHSPSICLASGHFLTWYIVRRCTWVDLYFFLSLTPTKWQELQLSSPLSNII